MLTKIHYKNIEKLFMFTRQTWAKWQTENRPIVKLIGYFKDEEIIELIKTGKIKKLEQANKFDNFLSTYRNLYFKFIKNEFGGINNMHNHLLLYYFQYLFFVKNNIDEFDNNQKPFYAAAVSFSLQYNLKFTKQELPPFHRLFRIFDLLDSDKGMWHFFSYILENNFDDFIKNIDIDKHIKNGKLNNYHKFGQKSLLTIEGIDHYYFFHCINNIHPYTSKEIGFDPETLRIGEEWEQIQRADEELEDKQNRADLAKNNIKILSSLAESRSGGFTLKDQTDTDVSFITSKEPGYPLLVNKQHVGISYSKFSSIMQDQDMASQFGNALANLDLSQNDNYDSIKALFKKWLH